MEVWVAHYRDSLAHIPSLVNTSADIIQWSNKTMGKKSQQQQRHGNERQSGL
jgi:hypothetical protein